jgi:hypothetical protein
MKELRRFWYQLQADAIIHAMARVNKRFVPILYDIGMDLNDKALRKEIELN